MLYLDITFTAVYALLYASWAEWVVHKHFMHKLFLPFSFAYDGHRRHHRAFLCDETYRLKTHPDDADKIRFVWWQGIALVIFGGIPFWIVAWVVGQKTTEAGVTFAGVSFVVFLLYYLAFEVLHSWMHNPTGRFFESWAVFRSIDRRHLLHHRYQSHNLNVVVPLADWIFDTRVA